MNYIWYIQKATIHKLDMAQPKPIWEILTIFNNGTWQRWTVDQTEENLNDAINLLTDAHARKLRAEFQRSADSYVSMETLEWMARHITDYERDCEA